ncbi:MbtH family NRPS accessory protein [Streptomyces sp. NPDC000410]|uniref:MbtH family NRPS accessory protein n=1 Tax=Streptomyces sp. NPDC000410 TaxID=3154254 RepID=UPI003330922F
MQTGREQAADVFVMLANGEGDHSLWPAAAPVPEGWSVSLTTMDRQRFLRDLGKQWPELRAVTLAKRGLFAA